MENTRLKVIASDSYETFEHEVNCYLAELDAQGLKYDLSFRNADKHCAYISYSNPKLRIPMERADGKKEYCRNCPEFSREHGGCDAYCTYHKRAVKYGGYCCSEYYQNDFGGVSCRAKS